MRFSRRLLGRLLAEVLNIVYGNHVLLPPFAILICFFSVLPPHPLQSRRPCLSPLGASRKKSISLQQCPAQLRYLALTHSLLLPLRVKSSLASSVPPFVSSEDNTDNVPLTPSKASKSIIFIISTGVWDSPLRKAGLLQSLSCPCACLPKSALSRCYPDHG